MIVAVVGGHGRVGAEVVRLLQDREDCSVYPVGRNDIHRIKILGPVCTHVVNCASVQLNSMIYAYARQPGVRMVIVGSARAYSRIPDARGDLVRFEQAKWVASKHNGVWLNPTMIYGGDDENVSVIRRMLRWLPVVPLPRNGEALIQPVHYEDVAKCIVAALLTETELPRVMAVGGGSLLTLRGFVYALGGRRGIGGIVNAPLWLLHVGAWLTRHIPWVPSISATQVERLAEDRNVDTWPMRGLLGVTPQSFPEASA